MAIVDFIENIVAKISKKNYVAAVTLDFKKAFDCVNRKILLQKLEIYGIRGIAYQWITSYFTNRSQIVKINDIKSNSEPIEIGVPQGSILGPLFFLVYINDIVNTTRLCQFFMFADDTNVVISADSYEKLCENTNKVLDSVSKWLCLNRIAINAKKCFTISFGCKDLANIKLSGETVLASNSIKYLGIIIDRNLTFRLNTEHVTAKLNRSIGVYRKLRNLIDYKTKILLYNSFFLSHLNYCVIIHGHKYKSFSTSFNLLQLRAISALFKCSHKQAAIIMKTNKLLDFHGIIKYNVAIFMFKAFNNQLPTQLLSLFTKYKDIHSRDSINAFNFLVSRAQNKLSYDCLSVYGVKIWNSLPIKLKQINSICLFKKELKRVLLTHQLT